MQITKIINPLLLPSLAAERAAFNAALLPVTVDANGNALPPGVTAPNPARIETDAGFVDYLLDRELAAIFRKHGLLPPPATPGIPTRVPASSGRAALIIKGRLAEVEQLIIDMPEATPEQQLQKQLTRNAFERDLYWDRANPYLQALAGPSGLNLTEADLDELFTIASQQP